MTLIEQIKAEIERLKGYYRITNPYDKRAIRVCENLLSFLDSLKSEKPAPKDLEEAADNHIRKVVDTAGHPGWDWTTQDIADAFIAGAKWQADHTPLPEDTVLFQKGVAEGKRLMMEEAVEGYVNYYEDSGGILMAEAQVGCPYHNGDKVRIIILPKED